MTFNLRSGLNAVQKENPERVFVTLLMWIHPFVDNLVDLAL